MNEPVALTIGVIARTAVPPVPNYRVLYIVRKHNINPVQRAGI